MLVLVPVANHMRSFSKQRKDVKRDESSHTSKFSSRVSSDTIHNSMSLVHRVTVSTATVQLSKIHDNELGNADSVGTIVLNNLIIHSKRPTTLDVRSGTRALLFDCEGILANGGLPDVGQSASVLAVDNLDLIGVQQ
jgi:hypothetical protein